MLPAQHRLTQARDFKKIKNYGQPFFSYLFNLRRLANQRPLSRFSVVVSTKVTKKATGRNRLKRQLRGIIRLNLAKIKPGYDIIIITKPVALAKNYQELEQTVLALLAKARLLK